MGSENQSVFRHLPEISIALRDASQPGVLELPSTPGIAKSGAFIRKELFRQRHDGLGVKDREGIESNGFDGWLCSGLRQGCGYQETRCHASGSQVEKFPTV